MAWDPHQAPERNSMATRSTKVFYATMYQGNIRTLNGKFPLLYRTMAGAVRESRRFTGVSVVQLDARDLDLAQCSIDDMWPTGSSTHPRPGKA